MFKQAVNQSCFLKAGLLGFQGSGKTYTSILLMMALHKFCQSKKPIYFCDTEIGSDWAIPLFKKEGIEFCVDKTRSFKSLIDDIKIAEKEAFGLIIDSISHYWKELMEAYQRKLGVKRLSLKHWMPIKQEWEKFSTAYVNSKLHLIVCGRAGWEWNYEEDENGDKELIKTGTKMKAEGEFGFEPSLLIEMGRTRKAEVGAIITHQGHVLKDRRMDEKSLDGKIFEWKQGNKSDQIFRDLWPHIELLNLGDPDHVGVDLTDNSQTLFDSSGDTQWQKEKKEKIIVIEEIEGLFQKHFPGRSTKETKAKLGLSELIFKTTSRTKIENMDLPLLKACWKRLNNILDNPDNIPILLGEKGGKIKEFEEAGNRFKDELTQKLSEFFGSNSPDRQEFLYSLYKVKEVSELSEGQAQAALKELEELVKA